MNDRPSRRDASEPSPAAEPTAAANPGYALGEFARAWATAQGHPDPATRERAEGRVAAWRRVLEGWLSGTLTPGARTPIRGVPAWATPRVLTGGFATGELLAGGPLQPHEDALRQELGQPADAASVRAALHAYFLTEDGLACLSEQLDSGRYRVEVPEEGALLTVAWLARNGHTARARELLTEIAPWFDRLRFYPVPHGEPLARADRLFLEPLAATVQGLDGVEDRPAWLAEREALAVWLPLFDRLLALFERTVVGEPPSATRGDDDRPHRSAAGSWRLEGGWPCQVYPEGWQDEAATWLAAYRGARQEHRRCRRPERPGSNFAVLRATLERCLADPASLSGREVGTVRRILALCAAKRGLPGSERWRELRAEQARQARLPGRRALAQLLVARLRPWPATAGLPSLEPFAAAVSDEEALRLGVPVGTRVPRAFVNRLRWSLEGTLEELVEWGALGSAEQIAQLLPQLAAPLVAAGLPDDAAIRLATAVHQAFSRRRSLLLLRLDRQVRAEDLPWMMPWRSLQRGEGREEARRLLERVLQLAVTSFPYAILPNKLVRELAGLSRRAGLSLPWVEEIAADIFVGQLTEKYLRAAQIAGQRLAGSLYEAYYGVPYLRITRLDDLASGPGQARVSPGLFALCCDLAGQTWRGWRGSVAQRGAILEQVQIVTTQNLGLLASGLGLEAVLSPRAPELARTCFLWIVRQLGRRGLPWHTQLLTLKNTAYAWRQMVFFLAIAPAGTLDVFLPWAEEHLAGQPSDFVRAFQPALAGLRHVARGGSLDGPREAGDPRRFLGWTTGKHWFLETWWAGA